jgi:hypothetical protein
MGDVEFIVAAGQTYGARELAETLAYELELQGMSAAVTIGPFPAPPADPAALLPVYVVVDPQRFVAAGGILPEPALWRRTIVVWTAGPPAQGDAELLERLPWAGTVFATSQRTLVALHRAGIRARLLRAGYTRRHDRFDPAAPRPLDVVFLGIESPRRTERLARAAEQLGDCRIEIVTAEQAPRVDEPGLPLAAARWDLLAQAEVVLAVHAGEDVEFDWPGALDAIHAGAVVVAEHSSAIGPLVPGEHLLTAQPDAVAHVARALLRDRPRLQSIRDAAHTRLRDWIPYALPASVLRAAVVELIGEPLAVPVLMAS